MKKIIGYGIGFGMNPFTGETQVVPMRAEVDEETGKVEFFIEKEEEKEPEVKETCFLCGDEVVDGREFHLRRGAKDWTVDAFHLCEECKDERRGRIKVS